MITVKNLHKTFGKTEVLKGIDYHVEKGEKIVIVGPSGSGKSTFLRCMNLLETPTSGEIWFDGKLITDPKTDINKVREHMGMVFQNFNLFNNLTIMDNIILAPTKLKLMNKEEAQETALNLLKRVNLTEKADAYPSQLSGGQRQRIAIARALYAETSVMVFDEPTANLDSESVKLFSEMIQNFSKDKICILVTHDDAIAAICDDVYRLEDKHLTLIKD